MLSASSLLKKDTGVLGVIDQEGIAIRAVLIRLIIAFGHG
jgi:hypothetical protein